MGRAGSILIGPLLHQLACSTPLTAAELALRLGADAKRLPLAPLQAAGVIGKVGCRWHLAPASDDQSDLAMLDHMMRTNRSVCP